jgi:branched-chain amino acid transport system ATP-binding protein
MALLEMSGIHLSFAGVTALDQVDLSIEDGTLQAVIGPNGAGKTSLFNCISGVYRPQRGSVQFGGHDLLSTKPHRVAGLGVARMFQNLAVFGQLTALENLLLGRHQLYRSAWWQDLLWTRTTRREEVVHRRRAEEVIEFLDLERYRKTPAAILPYGVLKRIELGRALCMDPRLLLLDEPAAGLNQEETEDMARYLLDVKEELGITMILIEHDLGFVLDLADRVAVLDFGHRIFEGTPDQVALDPAVIEAYVGGAEVPS